MQKKVVSPLLLRLRLRQKRNLELASLARTDLLFQRRVLDLLADLIREGVTILPEYQILANSIIVEAIERNELPGRPRHRQKKRVIDNVEERAAVNKYRQLRQDGATVDHAANEVAETTKKKDGSSVDPKTIKRWNGDARQEVLEDLREFDARVVANEFGFNLNGMIPAGVDFVLHVIEHQSGQTSERTGTPPPAALGKDGTPLWIPIPPDVEH